MATARASAVSRRTFLTMGSLALPGLLAACSAGGSRSAPDLPDFTLTAYQGDEILGGHTVKFSRLFERGKPVILNFWAGLCPPCRAEMPGFQKVFEQYHDKVLMVGVDVGPFVGLGEQSDARKLLADLRIRYPAAFALDSTPVRLYQVRAMPTTIFFTPEGRKVETVNGMLLEAQMGGKVERLIAQK